MKKPKAVIMWLLAYGISLVSFAFAAPTVLFLLYPYSAWGMVIYAVSVIVLSVLSFAPFSFNKRVVRKALISVLMLAVVGFLMILVAIQTGAIPFPG